MLYTDVDVLFLEKIDLHSFPPKLPETLAMANEITDEFPSNAGAVLYNLTSMRQSYHDLISFTMHAPGLHIGDNDGPADQGALNQFHEAELDSHCSLPENFKAKPYKLDGFDVTDDIFILHFHGPNSEHYLDFEKNRGCGPFSSDIGGGYFLNLCQQGLKNLCRLQLDVPKSLRSEGSWSTMSVLRGSGPSRLTPRNLIIFVIFMPLTLFLPVYMPHSLAITKRQE